MHHHDGIHTVPVCAAGGRASTGRPALRAWLPLFLVPSLLAGAARTQDAPPPEPWTHTQERINLAIDRGTDALLAQQELDGSWRDHLPGYPAGQSALCLYTLLKCGLPADHQAIRRALEFLHHHPPQHTYSCACAIMALATLPGDAQRARLRELSDQLLSWKTYAGYSYPAGAVDLSNTQYAALGLRYAAKSGVRIPRKVWLHLAEQTLAFQEPAGGAYEPAGFAYRPGQDATGSMTAAGVGILAICAEQLGRTTAPIAAGRRHALAWLERHFTVSSNPNPALRARGHPEPFGANHYYYLYGLERAANLLGLETFGPHRWYRLGARYLVDHQAADGRWERNQTSTCFALLFLTKATSPTTGPRQSPGVRIFGADDPAADLSLRASGDSPLAVWISSFGTAVRERCGTPSAGGRRRLAIRRVEYLREALPPEKAPVRLALIERPPGAELADQRCAVRCSFELPGAYRIFAEVTLAGASGEPPPPPLRSKPLEVRISQAYHEELPGYAADAGRNLLAGAKVVATASSELNTGWAARCAADNLQGSAWCSADDDPTPRITLELDPPLRANTLALTHACDLREIDRNRSARIRALELRINNSRKVQRIEMDPRERHKSVFALKRTTTIRKLELQVIEVRPSHTPQRGVGLAEIELWLRKGRRRNGSPSRLQTRAPPLGSKKQPPWTDQEESDVRIQRTSIGRI